MERLGINPPNSTSFRAQYGVRHFYTGFFIFPVDTAKAPISLKKSGFVVPVLSYSGQVERKSSLLSTVNAGILQVE